MKIPSMKSGRPLVDQRRGAGGERAGFTLIELLIVVVVIGILASTAIPKFAAVKEKAYRSQALADMQGLRTAEESFYADSNRYGTLAELSTKFSKTSGVGFPTVNPSLSYWSATLTHPHIPGMVCGIAVGTVNPVAPGTGEGEAICK
jgi:prepilin-type N-terminal cleavage/methylation domain-containing protein